MQEKWQDQSCWVTNRFIMVLFGDLKNYKFIYKSFLLEDDSAFIQQRKANMLSSFVSEE